MYGKTHIRKDKMKTFFYDNTVPEIDPSVYPILLQTICL